MRDLSKLVKDLINVIPKEEAVILKLESRLSSIEFLLLPEQIPMHEEIIYEIISGCLPNDVEYNDLKNWQKEVIEIWNKK